MSCNCGKESCKICSPDEIRVTMDLVEVRSMKDDLIDTHHSLGEIYNLINSYRDGHSGKFFCDKCCSYNAGACAETILHEIARICEERIY